MDVIWTKGKLHRTLSNDTVTPHAHASGDGAATADSASRCCRLCGDDRSLRHFAETYVWEGTEGSYDQLLYDCFGVVVSSLDCMICERCIRQLRNMQKFKALVCAAFDKPSSECISEGVGDSFPELKKEELNINTKRRNTELKMKSEPPRRRETTNKKNSFYAQKKINIPCSVCKQKYLMVIPYGGLQNFVCSRCKKDKEQKSSFCRRCNVIIPADMMKDHLELHAKADKRRRFRLNNTLKKSPQMKKTVSLMKNGGESKYECSQCSKRYQVIHELTEHISSAHAESLNCTCTVCGKTLKTRYLLKAHLRSHTGETLFQCETCLKTFKSKRGLQSHALTHKKVKSSSY